MSATVLITGTSGGFGRLTTERLLARGHRVVATMREVGSRNARVAAALRAVGAIVIELDVTRDVSVDAAIAQALREIGPLDAVVNNAGVGVLGPQEAFSADDLMRVYDINVVGVHRVVRAVAPHFRSQGRGLIVNVSSLLGRITMPFYGPYNAAKWALEALSENYRAELSAQGIEVAIVEPGGFATTFADALLRPSDIERTAMLSSAMDAATQMLAGFTQLLQASPQQDPGLVADAMVALIEAPHGQRPFRTVVDRIGMAEVIEPYNAALEDTTRTLYRSMHMEHLLSVTMPTGAT